MATKDDVPGYDELFNPTLGALRNLGGSASIQELVEEIANILRLSEDVVDVDHGQGGYTELGYRAAWARTYLKNCGLVLNSERGIWALTAHGLNTKKVDPRSVVKNVRRRQRESRPPETEVADTSEHASDQVDWRERLLNVLLDISPEAFERLCQRLLREAGFIEVEVSRRSGDGGIDGQGIIRPGGLISFNVLFQSKRYRGNCGPDVVRDFRGAMIGRADKGLIITTGGFTREVRREATRDGAPPIDLIDGQLLTEKLKDLRLGVSVELVESVSIHSDFFRQL